MDIFASTILAVAFCGTSDPKSLVFGYQILILRRLNWVKFGNTKISKFAILNDNFVANYNANEMNWNFQFATF